jgi:hypothetical protein
MIYLMNVELGVSSIMTGKLHSRLSKKKDFSQVQLLVRDASNNFLEIDRSRVIFKVEVSVFNDRP